MNKIDKGAAFLDAEAERKPKLRDPRRFSSELHELWRAGFPSGEKTGWPDLDKHYTVMPGQLSIVTGWPGSGKSEFLDALLVNLARQGWKMAVFSFENQPVSYHLTKLLEKYRGLPFGPGPSTRMDEDELDEILDTIAESFALTEATSNAFTLNDCLEAATPFLEKFTENKRGLVIDPWNELEHWRTPGMSETEYVSWALSMVRNWARSNKVHVWIVAHPQKVRREEGKLPVPTPDMISGSQHWWNKADCCLCVQRDLNDPYEPNVDIHIQKVRFKHIGRTGQIQLRYDRVTGRYHAIAQKPAGVTMEQYRNRGGE